ncbi:alpha/beta-hydrolase [Aspergillus steynii IBT 23096]|uniref:Alpha/beta-hydrolase n=1 Tax=Aspergillus steynii IBT 23096 TaxID=1392250 RepID=A0A2I2GAX8_9EURO|nr:alpha/beta-hydrolase [Aspergillus steynii IBT 23096]PLB50007.1 alpha/beta-hydrolase [Aspergillus steynii IBT 23096]
MTTITNTPTKRASIQQKQNAVRSRCLQNPRTFFTDAIPTVLIPPTIFTTLLLGLWTWKCFWIVVMQDKLLYIAWLPPFARSEQIADYEGQCGPVRWEGKQIRSLDGTKLTVCEGRMKSAVGSHVHGHSDATASLRDDLRNSDPTKPKKRVVICYFQGNGGSTPLRLPLLSDMLRTVTSATEDPSVEYIVTALSYRGYWTSSGRATQSGIELDAQAFLAWASRTYAGPDTDLRLVLWGHSLGSAIASTALATDLARRDGRESSVGAPISGLVMEAPTSSTKDMLISLYPQKWLPYRYLWPFLWNNWDSSRAMERMAKWRDECPGMEAEVEEDGDDEKTMAPGLGTVKPRRIHRSLPPILMLSAEKDEVIPPHAVDQLEADARRMGLVLERKDVAGAMHTEALVKVEGKRAVVNFLLSCT